MSIILPLLKRMGELVLLSLLVTLATFILSSWLPGDYFSSRFLDASVGHDTIEQLRRQYGLDQPVLLQYLHWLRSSFKLDMGYSLLYREPVFPVVIGSLAKTLWLGIPALILGLGGGVMLGTLHGVHQNGTLGRSLSFLSGFMLSLPSLVLGILALLLAAQTRWFPLGGMSSNVTQHVSYLKWLFDRLHHLALPAACLMVPVLAAAERIQFSAIRSSIGSRHLRSAMARGLSRQKIILRHLIRPSLNPVLSTSGPILGGVLSGSLVLEVLFAWPGLGRITYDALFNNDLYLLAGCVVACSFLLVMGNLIADVLVLLLDPRTRESRGKP